MKDNDILLYTDTGSTIPNEPYTVDKLREYIDSVNQSDKGVLVFKNPHIENAWTNGNVFRHFGVFDDPSVYNTRQFSGGRLHVIKKCDHSIKLYKLWWKTAVENPFLFSDHPSPNNFPGFIENRHDQSVFSILCKVHGVEEEYDWDSIPVKATKLL